MTDIAPRTHNAPPDPIQAQQEDLHERLTGENGDLDNRIKDLEAAADRGSKQTIDTEELAEAFTEQLAQIGRAIKESKGRHAKAKAPFLTLGNLVDNFFARREARLIAARDMLAPKLTAWQTLKQQRAREEARQEAERQRAEQDRIRREREAREQEERAKAEAARLAQQEAHRIAEEARQAAAKARKAADDAARAEADRLAAEAAAAQRNAQSAQIEAEDANRDARLHRQQEVQQQMITNHVEQQERRAGGSGATRVRGGYGAKAILRQVMDFEIDDPTKVPRAYCSPDEAKIRAAINGDAPVKRIQGVRIFQKQTTQVRT